MCRYVYIHMYIHVYNYLYVYTFICICMCVYMCARVHAYIYIYAPTTTQPCTRTRTRTHIHTQKVPCRYSTEKETHVRPSERVIRRNKSLIRLTGSPLAEVRKKRSGEKRCQKRLTTYFNKNLQTSKDTNATDIRELVWYDCGTENTAKLSYIHQKESTM